MNDDDIDDTNDCIQVTLTRVSNNGWSSNNSHLYFSHHYMVLVFQ
jgi:hypothetical protein